MVQISNKIQDFSILPKSIMAKSKLSRNIVLITLLCVFELSTAMEIDEERHEDEFDCVGLYGETRKHTDILLKECNLLMSTNIMRATREYIKSASKDELEKARQEYHDSKKETIFRPKRSIPKVPCPVMNQAYLKQNDMMSGMRSLSPYAEKLDYNPTRFPKFIAQKYCLCDGCIKPTLGTETSDFISHLVTAQSRIFLQKTGGKSSYRLAKQSISVGCTCVQPDIS
uniref:interleukin-17B-like n=1 Tax=Styela clava TaxID=7725 RepID=UPI001939BA53|nr:interleukin-17B-like [Styela clava]